MDIGWLYLSGAILFELGGTVCLKYSDGFTRWPFVVGLVSLYGLCFFMLSLTLRTIQLSVAYAIWGGIGTLLIATIGIFVFKEPFTWLKAASILLIVGGVVGLNLGGTQN
jgi:small multidrug resistance pump